MNITPRLMSPRIVASTTAAAGIAVALAACGGASPDTSSPTAAPSPTTTSTSPSTSPASDGGADSTTPPPEPPNPDDLWVSTVGIGTGPRVYESGWMADTRPMAPGEMPEIEGHSAGAYVVTCVKALQDQHAEHYAPTTTPKIAGVSGPLAVTTAPGRVTVVVPGGSLAHPESGEAAACLMDVEGGAITRVTLSVPSEEQVAPAGARDVPMHGWGDAGMTLHDALPVGEVVIGEVYDAL